MQVGNGGDGMGHLLAIFVFCLMLLRCGRDVLWQALYHQQVSGPAPAPHTCLLELASHVLEVHNVLRRCCGVLCQYTGSCVI
mmetsp:Transcript_349/g.608  ORF Transcript_349/g.608 Transcript_349/m.608 type:complete len:82 (-) Transcript_349:1116-1361(-)